MECLDAVTGAAVWKYAYPSHFTDPYGYNNGPRCTPLLTTNYCITFGAEGRLTCLDFTTGKPVWSRETGKDWQVPEAFFGVGSTPVLEGNTLLVMVGGQTNAAMVGLDVATGKTRWESVGSKNWTGQPMLGFPGERTVEWRTWDKQASYASPRIATINGKRLAFCVTRQGLVTLDPATGEVNFSRWFRSAANDSVNASTPVVVDDLVFISAAYYKVGSVLLRVKPDGKGFEEVWKGLGLEMHWSTPIYLDGYLYGFSGRNEPDAHFRCIEFKTGKVMWDRDETWAPHSTLQPAVLGRASSVLAEGKFFVLGEGGNLAIVKPNPQKPEEVARFQMPQLHYPCWAAPVLSHQRLYLRSEDRLVCVEAAAARP